MHYLLIQLHYEKSLILLAADGVVTVATGRPCQRGWVAVASFLDRPYPRGWVSSGSYDGNVREYADFANAQGTVFTIDLNANAITDINAAMTDNSEFHIMLLHENDFLNDTTLLNTPATTGGGAANGDGGSFRSSEDASISLRPLLTVVYGEEEAAVTNNANFFGSNF